MVHILINLRMYNLCIPRTKKSVKKASKWISLCCTVGYKWVTVMDGNEFEFNDMTLLYTKNDF